MALKQLTERVGFQGGKVDRSGAYPVVRGVLLCGLESANRRRYAGTSFGPASEGRYKDKLVFANHGERGKSRGYEERLGWVESESRRADGAPTGDIGVNPKHPLAEQFLFDAEHRPCDIGMSHVAMCEARAASDGWEEVTRVAEVESVDVVIGPATAKKGLFEQKGQAVGKISLRKFGERYGPKWGPKKWGAFERLCEEYGAAMDAPVMDEPPPAAAGAADEGDLKTALMSAITPMLAEAFESGDATKVCAAIKDFIKLHAKHTGKGGGGGETETETETEEQKKPKPADPFAVLAECERADYRPGPAELKALALMTESERAAFVTEQRAKVPAEKVKTAERRPGAGTAGAVKTEAKPTTEQRLIPAWD